MKVRTTHLHTNTYTKRFQSVQSAKCFEISPSLLAVGTDLKAEERGKLLQYFSSSVESVARSSYRVLFKNILEEGEI